MAGHGEQEQLPLVRPRVPLIEDEEEIRVRLPKAAAAAVQANPEAAVRALAEQAQRQLAEITDKNVPVGQVLVDGQLRQENVTEKLPDSWLHLGAEAYSPWESKEDPPRPGTWMVTDHKTGAMLKLWWFGGAYWYKGDPRLKGTTVLSADQFRSQYAWRGLKECPSWPYPVPPYSPQELPHGAGLDGKYVKRTRVVAEP